jgi:hypothetical protein
MELTQLEGFLSGGCACERWFASMLQVCLSLFSVSTNGQAVSASAARERRGSSRARVAPTRVVQVQPSLRDPL